MCAVFLFLLSFYFQRFFLPVLFGLTIPTFLPGGAFLFAILLFALFPLPEPNGWSTTFTLIGEVLGHNLPCAFMRWCFLPALTKGLSSLPPPAIVPTIALQFLFNFFSFFDGNMIWA